MANPSAFADSFEIVPITTGTLKEAVAVIVTSYFADEGVSRGVNLTKSVEATTEVGNLMRLIAEDGISLVAIEKDTKKVVGAFFVKLQVNRDNTDTTFFADYGANCRHPSAKMWLEVMNYGATFSTATNMYKLCNTKCYSEGVCVAVRRDYRGRGIATKLEEAWIEMTISLKNGTTKRTPLDVTTFFAEDTIVPTAMSAVATEAVNYRILRKLGFKCAASLKYSSLSYQGVSFDKVVREGNKALKVVYKIL